MEPLALERRWGERREGQDRVGHCWDKLSPILGDGKDEELTVTLVMVPRVLRMGTRRRWAEGRDGR